MSAQGRHVRTAERVIIWLGPIPVPVYLAGQATTVKSVSNLVTIHRLIIDGLYHN